MNPPITPIKPPVTIDGPLIPGLIPNKHKFNFQFQFPNSIRLDLEWHVERKEVRVLTGEIADGDRNAGDGDESEIVEGVEVADDFGERRVAINDWVLWLRRCSDVCVHLSSFLLIAATTHRTEFCYKKPQQHYTLCCCCSHLRSFMASIGPFFSSFALHLGLHYSIPLFGVMLSR